MKIGIIREGKVPIDKRTPLTPKICVELMQRYADLQIVVQPSKIRVVLDEEYKALKIPLQEDLGDCDYIFGIKEVPAAELISGKSYFFFSHTIKKQENNRNLLKKILEKKCILIDYECIKNERGERLVSFGHFAGVVGAYNAIKTYGTRYRLFDVKPAHLCYDYAELRTQFKKIKLKAVKIAVTGGGRVAKGVLEVLNQLHVKEVNVHDYLTKQFSRPVFVNLHSEHYHVKKGTNFFDKKDFFKNPSLYVSQFMPFAEQTDILIAAAFWNPGAPRLFTMAQAQSGSFKIKVIGDITCDLNGSIPSTLRTSSIDNPVYDYNPFTHDLEVPYSSEKNITVMAIDNLPCELSRDASDDFGRQLVTHVFPALMEGKNKYAIENAIIAKNGELTPKYHYLNDYVAN